MKLDTLEMNGNIAVFTIKNRNDKEEQSGNFRHLKQFLKQRKFTGWAQKHKQKLAFSKDFRGTQNQQRGQKQTLTNMVN